MISEGPCDTDTSCVQDWCNDAENSALHEIQKPVNSNRNNISQILLYF